MCLFLPLRSVHEYQFLFGRQVVASGETDLFANLTGVAKTLCDKQPQVREKFSIDEHRHYLFTPRDLTTWVRGLLRYDLESEDLLDCVAYEVWI